MAYHSDVAEQQNKLNKLFKELDTNNDQQISRQELKEGLIYNYKFYYNRNEIKWYTNIRK